MRDFLEAIKLLFLDLASTILFIVLFLLTHNTILAVGLGMALARPDKKVMLFDSEGDIQMSLGILATVAEQAPSNLYHFLIDNGVYATTGGQPVPNADNIQYDMIARGCGYPRTYAFTEIGDFERVLPEIMGKPGPVFVACKVVPEIENEPIGRRRRWQTRTRDQVVADLRAELGAGDPRCRDRHRLRRGARDGAGLRGRAGQHRGCGRQGSRADGCGDTGRG